MDELRCPCGHLVSEHSRIGSCCYKETLADGRKHRVCACKLGYFESYRAAQRKAAAEHLLGLLVEYWQLKKVRYTAGVAKWHQIMCVAKAYHTVGILGRKGGE